MNVAAAVKTHAASISRPDRAAPILLVNSAASLAIRGGTVVRASGVEHRFDSDTPVGMPDLIAGEDYGVKVSETGQPFASLLGPENPIEAGWIAGFHYAPGGNATARAGGDDTPAINPHSLWDLGRRPACADPRGMTCVELAGGKRVWIDIYLLCVDRKRHGTSRCGVTIADGRSLARLNYHDAVAVMAEHGKRLPTYDEFRTAAFGVTERSSADSHAKTTGLDAARTSAIGLMQATGNLWIWGTDGDPDDPAPSLFGGSWIDGSSAGSRCAYLDYWPGYSNESLSARGACDHLAA
ncbi:hypothetical protein [Shinella zoogloeoides]|uniref:phage major tropism determinant n=1 Tax=Shinella zoogloeoides TaxID=352475 RepID=UPI0028A660F5|nr:hypothetical protein [Shinella zoogloeoides]